MNDTISQLSPVQLEEIKKCGLELKKSGVNFSGEAFSIALSDAIVDAVANQNAEAFAGTKQGERSKPQTEALKKAAELVHEAELYLRKDLELLPLAEELKKVDLLKSAKEVDVLQRAKDNEKQRLQSQELAKINIEIQERERKQERDERDRTREPKSKLTEGCKKLAGLLLGLKEDEARKIGQAMVMSGVAPDRSLYKTNDTPAHARPIQQGRGAPEIGG